MKKTFLGLLFGLLLLFVACAPASFTPKYEFRGAWVATVKNIDWPSRAGLPTDLQKSEFKRIASHHADAGMNALVVQVRPSTDAMYPSELEPWSEWLTGIQGLPPDPIYDPLAFMIQETHHHGMEFHAWLNPYRAIIDADTVKSALNHITRLQPSWFLRYGKNLYFDPGIPEARAYLVGVIEEMVKNYDLDGIHFDDYFYPYKIAGVDFPDSVSFQLYGNDFSDIGDWRRNNVNKLVKELHDVIKAEKPWVKFGISPFGVWRNQSVDPTGSATRAGQTNYDDLYADILLWQKNGWLDYVAPQIYWHMGFAVADYTIIADWWAKHDYDRHVYIGQATYRIGSEISEEWKNPMEMPRHMRYLDQYSQIQGNIFYNTNSLLQNKLGFTDSLRNDFYRNPALTPKMPWIDSLAPEKTKIQEVKDLKKGIHLNWQASQERGSRYVIYRWKGKKVGSIADPSAIVAILTNDQNFFTDETTKKGKKYTYLVTVLDRLNNESEASEPITIKRKNAK